MFSGHCYYQLRNQCGIPRLVHFIICSPIFCSCVRLHAHKTYKSSIVYICRLSLHSVSVMMANYRKSLREREKKVKNDSNDSCETAL